jgi:hypothetical protein
MDINKLVDEANKLGMTSTSLQQLQYAFSTMGISAEVATRSVNDLNRSLARAGDGSRKTLEAFARLNISYKELSKIPADKQLLVIADALKAVDNPLERNRLGLELLGKSFQELRPFIEGGSEGFAKLALESAKIGKSLSEIDVQNIKNMTTQFTLAKDSVTGVFNILSASVAPIVSGILETLNRWLVTGDNFRNIVLSIVNGFGTVAVVVGTILDVFKTIINLGTIGFNTLFAGVLKSVDLISSAFELVIRSVRGSINAIISIINTVIALSASQINFLIRTANKIPGLNMVQLDAPEIAKLAETRIEQSLDRISDKYGFMASELIAENGRLFRGIGDNFENGFAAKALNVVGKIQDGVIGVTTRSAKAAEEITQASMEAIKQTVQLTKNEINSLFADQQIEASLKTFVNKFSDGFAEILISGKSFGSQLKQLFANILHDIVKQWLSSMIKMALATLLIRAGGGATSGFAGALTSAGQALMPRRTGGPVDAGRSYMVGEAGAEMFIPQTRGTIISNKNLNGGMNGTPSVTYNIYAYDTMSVEQVIERNRPRLAQDALLAFQSASSRRRM